MRIVAIGGEPGSGKSTLMQKIIDDNYTVHEDFKLVPYLKHDNVYVLGKYGGEGYAQGTDRMSMAAQPAVVNFLKTLPTDSIVLFEGDRLFNSSFLEECNDVYDLKIVYLKTDKSVRTQRYKERGSVQNEKWLEGRETKISNILSNFNLMFLIEKFENNTLKEQEKVYDYIMSLIKG